MRRLHRPVLLACALVGSALFATSAVAGPSSLVGALDDPIIYGGEPVSDCGFPTTVEVNGCTGTLVHPNVVITAAHCFEFGSPSAQIVFGENFQSPARTIASACTAHSGYDGFSAQNDIAYCVLNESIDDVPIVPVLMGCATAALKAGQEVAVVGFGVADDNLGDGPKREVFTTINSVANGEAYVGGNGSDSCQGDSGGPVYIPMADGSWRVFGITSYGGECGGGGYYSMMHSNIGWAEQGSGYDLTPCHDADGSWNPTAACTSSPTEPHLGGGSWAEGCAGGTMKAVVEVCEGGTVDASGGDDGGGDDGSGSGGADEGTTDGGGAEAGSGEGDDGSGTDTNSATGSAGEASSGTSDDGMFTDDADGGGGCSLTASRTHSGGFELLMLMLIAPLRRRRGRLS